MSSLLVFNRVYRLAVQWVIFAPPPQSSLWFTSPSPFPKYSISRQYVAGRGWGVELRCSLADHILQKFNTLFLTRFRTYSTKLLHNLTQKPRRAGGKLNRPINTCRKVHLCLALLSISLIFLLSHHSSR